MGQRIIEGQLVVQGDIIMNGSSVVNADSLNQFREDAIETKFDKTGGQISGDVTISGSLTVQGTSTAIDTETIIVKDNIVVTNGNGVDLLDNAGFAIKTNATTVYGIMYNPIDDGVMIGEGSINSLGNFMYTEGEAQYLATVDWAIEDGNIAQWDGAKKTFVDSGSKIPKIVRLI